MSSIARSHGWNYRVMRHEETRDGESEVFYAIHEVHYAAANKVRSWTQEPCGSPFGETLEEMTGDLAWILTALTKPVLEFSDGSEVGPAAMLADDLLKWFHDTKGAGIQ